VLPMVRLSKVDRFWYLILSALRVYLVGVGLLIVGTVIFQLVSWLSGRS